MNNELLAIGGIVGIIILLAVVWYMMRPEYKRYKSDTLYDAQWRWDWQGRNIVGLWCYCPTCKGALSFDDTLCQSTSKLGEKTTYLICTHCDRGQVAQIKGGDRRYVLKLVQREILRKAQTKTFILQKDKNEQ